jgi:hypothetical protein
LRRRENSRHDNEYQNGEEFSEPHS